MRSLHLKGELIKLAQFSWAAHYDVHIAHSLISVNCFIWASDKML